MKQAKQMKQFVYGNFPVLHKVHIKGATLDDKLTLEDKPELTRKFSRWGKIQFVQVHTKSYNNDDLDRPYGFITFKDKTSVISCLQDSAVGVTLEDGRLIMPRQALFNLKYSRDAYRDPEKTEQDRNQLREKTQIKSSTPTVSEAEDKSSDESSTSDEEKKKPDEANGSSESDLEMQLLSDVIHD